ncbi:MAG: hypothetical protein AAF483_26315 [Planctomycetota bacterium]
MKILDQHPDGCICNSLRPDETFGRGRNSGLDSDLRLFRVKNIAAIERKKNAVLAPMVGCENQNDCIQKGS